MSTFSIPYPAEETSGDDRGVLRGGVDVSGIPAELKARAQWVVWWRGDQRPDGRYAKVPHMPQTSAPASSNDPMTWGTFDQALTAFKQQGYDGIGFMLSADDPFLVIDLDRCHDRDTGALTAEATSLLARFNSYAEVSPSGTGVHVYLQAASPAGRNVTKPYEVYSRNHFITITGERLPNAPTFIEARQHVFNAWYCEMFGAAKGGADAASNSHRDPAAQMPPLTTDEVILRRVQRSAKATKLWAGDRSGYASGSEADAALIACLVRWTRDAAQLDRLFRRSGLYRPKWDRLDYAQTTIANALAKVAATQRPARRVEQRIIYTYDWQRRVEAPGERDEYLRRHADEAKEAVHQQITEGGDAPLVITLAPGVGKTHVVAELGNTHDVAWIGPRHDLFPNVAQVASFRHILPCSQGNCPDADKLNALARLGYNIWPMHRKHNCDYYRQFGESGSAFYQVAHVPTAFPKEHEAAIVDEFDVAAWLNTRSISLDQVTDARLLGRWTSPGYEPVAELLYALFETMVEAGQRGAALHGKALMDTLERHSGGKLAELLDQVSKMPVMDERPKVACELDAGLAEARGTVIVPFIVAALREDLPKWRHGGEWNSRTHISKQEDGLAMRIITPRQFRRDTAPWPYAILDATADADLLARIVGQLVTLKRHDIVPPPHTRHLAARIRTLDGSIKRYSKRSLVGKDHMGKTEQQRVAEEQERVVRAITHLLEREGLRGKKIGLITYRDCKEALGEALNIPEKRRGHFWAVRGSNDFEDCEVLLVVGTPIQNLRGVEWMARALYANDPTPIDAAQEGKRYRDSRLAGLLEYLVNAELTQVAHRNRPMRHDGRVVITFTSGMVDYLPITEEITSFGDLPTRRRKERKAATCREQAQRLRDAYEALVARQETATVRRMAREAKVRTAAASDWLGARREQLERFPNLQ